MKCTLILGILVCMLSTSLACLARSTHRDPNHPEDCAYNSETLMGVGDVLPLPTGQCGQIECRRNNEVLTMGCPVIQAERGCRLLEADTTASYPRCCDRKQVCNKYGSRKRSNDDEEVA